MFKPCLKWKIGLVRGCAGSGFSIARDRIRPTWTLHSNLQQAESSIYPGELQHFVDRDPGAKLITEAGRLVSR